EEIKSARQIAIVCFILAVSDLSFAFVATIDATFVLFPEQNHVVLFILAGHTRRTAWHTGHRKPECIRLFPQELLQCCCGHMSFDQVTRHLGGVTGLEIEWYAQSGLHTVELLGLDHFPWKAVIYKVRDQTATATAVRVLVNGHRWPS